MKTFTSFKELEKTIKRDIAKKIDSVLENEVAIEAKKIVQKHVREDVYNAGHPIYYKRRYHNGGMIDEENLEESVNNGELTITNMAKMNPMSGEDWLYDGYSLSHLVIDGWSSPFAWYNKPRPYMEYANYELENNPNIQEAIDKGLNRQGVKKIT